MLSFKDFLVANLYAIIEQHWPVVPGDPYTQIQTIPDDTQVDSEGAGLGDIEEPVETPLEDGHVDTKGLEALAHVLGLEDEVEDDDEDEVEATFQEPPGETEVIETLPGPLALPVEPPRDSQVPEDTMDFQEAAAPSAGEPGVAEVVGGLEDASGSPIKPSESSPSVAPTELEHSPSPPAVHTAAADMVVEVNDSPEPSKNKHSNLAEVSAQIEALRILVCIADIFFWFHLFKGTCLVLMFSLF